ncbi:rod shape-determining protein MreC [Butyrivibrio sp. MC2013]|uniref:rod shape-determining protein MreC n=1 Tax=Butyrivibrio sp. MC2013 TaxID=1280686 RepID=UPI0004261AA4|nr:rod shape-determining protein MreC [Butyrivibrio sp. MC2013]
MNPVINKRGDKFSIPGKYLLFALTIVSIALIVITLTTNLFSGVAGTVAGVFVVPFQKGISTAGSYVKDKAEYFADMSTLREENGVLRQQVEELKEENARLTQDKYELDNLRDLYELDKEYSSYSKTGARIIARDTGNWYSNFVIDKGTDDGLDIDMNIIAGGGLVGRITSIGPGWSKVTSVISDNISTSSMVLNTGDNLIVTGDLESYSEGVITFSKLQDDIDAVSIGDKVVTSNISDKYLPGILVGYITSIEADSNNLTKSGTLTPAVDFEHLDEVLVITSKKQVINSETPDD